MKNFKALFILFIGTILLTGCFEDNDDNQVSANEINDFVWKGMNSWYNWQSLVTDLADTKDDNAGQYAAYLNQYSDPEELFNSLRYQYGVIDRFSWFIPDYIEQEQQFQGISKSFRITSYNVCYTKLLRV